MNDTIPIYTGRTLEIVAVRAVHAGGSVTWSKGWSFAGIPSEHQHHFTEGREVLVETVNLTQVTGIALDRDQWLWRKSDQDLEVEHQQLVEANRRHDEERWQEHQADWSRREEQLPSALRRRLSRFRINGGHEFEISGWGYELTVSELAVLYRDSNGADDDAVDRYARTHGTSGNQHHVAQILAGSLTNDPTDQDRIANFPSALTPITGDADYSKAGR